MRRFELTEGTSSKFWEIEVRRTELVVRFGRIGSAGQTRTKKMKSTAAAIAALRDLVEEKRKKGYREVRGKKVAAAVAARAPAPVVSPAAKRRRPATKKRVGIVPASPVPASAIPEIWARIEKVFAERHPSFDLGLRPPASEARIEAAERALGVRFPDDFRASLRVHDGQDDEVLVLWLPIALRLGSLESIVRCWKDDRKYYDEPEMAKRMDWLDLEGTERVRQVHLHPKQIPIAGTMDWDLDRLLLDFVPGPKGREGQVIARYDVDFRFVADTFGALLDDVATRLESGETTPRAT